MHIRSVIHGNKRKVNIIDRRRNGYWIVTEMFLPFSRPNGDWKVTEWRLSVFTEWWRFVLCKAYFICNQLTYSIHNSLSHIIISWLSLSISLHHSIMKNEVNRRDAYLLWECRPNTRYIGQSEFRFKRKVQFKYLYKQAISLVTV